ncbi:hypothetical protein, partial [Vibrio parahaemolyticus]|uniref:hypothetical protein n=1 Tax=Vibrio parahaemolyticus TaxID=670 RepID=UPI00308119C3
MKIGQLSKFFFSPTCVLRLSSSLAVVPLASAFQARSLVLYFNILACAKGFRGSVLTNNSRGIRNAWHFYYALILVIKVVCSGIGIALL